MQRKEHELLCAYKRPLEDPSLLALWVGKNQLIGWLSFTSDLRGNISKRLWLSSLNFVLNDTIFCTLRSAVARRQQDDWISFFLSSSVALFVWPILMDEAVAGCSLWQIRCSFAVGDLFQLFTQCSVRTELSDMILFNGHGVYYVVRSLFECRCLLDCKVFIWNAHVLHFGSACWVETRPVIVLEKTDTEPRRHVDCSISRQEAMSPF